MEAKLVYQVNPEHRQLPDIEGLAEIKAATAAWVNYHQAKMEFERGERDFEDVPAYNPRKIDELKAKYPRAAAYLEADRWTYVAAPIKNRLGAIACERLLNGEDPDVVLSDMSRGLDAFYLAQEG